MSVFHPLFIAALSGLVSYFGTKKLLPVLKRHVLDMPNARSNHKEPVPRGGGIAMIGAALLGFLFLGMPLLLILAALLLAYVSFADDRGGLPVRTRLAAQLVAVALGIHVLPGPVFGAFPGAVEWILVALGWLWFINLTNFMDGIDGISAMQAIMVSAGIALIAWTWHMPAYEGAAFVMMASAWGFYRFNRSPAKLFMGDVGSVPLGFLMGYLLLSLAAQGYLLSALILPAYYLSDATYTLFRRAKRHEKVWQAHSEHAYQQAARGGLSHRQIVSCITRLNALLIALAFIASLSMIIGVLCVIVAYGLTFRLIRHFSHEAVS